LDDTGRLLLCPDGLGDCPSADFSVTVRNAAGNPVENAVVEILVGCQVSGEIELCENQTLGGTTNADGKVWFNIGGGGCCWGSGVIEIRANGMTIRSFDKIMSPDYEFSGVYVGQPAGGDLTVDPVDLSAFVGAYQGGLGPTSCHDYDNSGETDPVDLGTFVVAYRGGLNFCDPW
jgi:hypothetical protein